MHSVCATDSPSVEIQLLTYLLLAVDVDVLHTSIKVYGKIWPESGLGAVRQPISLVPENLAKRTRLVPGNLAKRTRSVPENLAKRTSLVRGNLAKRTRSVPGNLAMRTRLVPKNFAKITRTSLIS